MTVPIMSGRGDARPGRSLRRLVGALDDLPLGDDYPPGDTDVGEVRGDFDDAGERGTIGMGDPHDRAADGERLAPAEPQNALEPGAHAGFRAGVLPVSKTALGEVEHVLRAAVENQCRPCDRG